MQDKVYIIISYKWLIDYRCFFEDVDSYHATFYNSHKHPIDVIWITYDGKEKTYKSKLAPASNFSIDTYFTHQWIFKDSMSKDPLIANANGIVDDVFEGCQFKAQLNQPILVTVSNGNVH